MTQAELEQVDSALIRLRRLWLRPETKLHLRRDLGAPVEMSHVLVVHAVAHGPRRGERDGDVSVGLVATRLDVDESTASRLVGAAAAAGYVARRRSATDTRRTVLSLTGSGRALLLAAEAYRRAYLERLLDGWDAEELATFARLLARFADAVATVPQVPPDTGGSTPGRVQDDGQSGVGPR